MGVISVIVPTYRRPASLVACLEGLRNQSRPPDEIIVVVRNGDHGSAKVLGDNTTTDVRCVEVVAPGVLAAMLAGVEHARGDILAFTDDDAVARVTWLERLVAMFGPEIGAVGGRDNVVHEVCARTRDVGRVTSWGRLVGNHHLGDGSVRDVDVLKGVNMAFRREAFALPEALAGVGAQVHFEVAACLHAQGLGWRILYDPAAVVDHYPAERFDPDRRWDPSHSAVHDAAFNFVLCLLSFRSELFGRRAAYGLLVGDRGIPGLGRAVIAVARRERAVVRSVMPSLLGQLRALWRICRGRRVRMTSAPVTRL